MEAKELANRLYALELGDKITLPLEETLITRVPGGWIYSIWDTDSSTESSVFVPFSDEFMVKDHVTYRTSSVEL